MKRFLPILFLLLAFASVCQAQIGIPRFNVRRYGAVPNGKKDDAPAIAKAIAAAEASRGRAIVYFPPGRYLLASVPPGAGPSAPWITVTGAHGLTLLGSGDSTLVSTDVSRTCLKLVKCTNIEVASLNFDADPLPFTQGVIKAVNASAKTVDVQVSAGYGAPNRADLAQVSAFLPFTQPASGSWQQTPSPPSIVSRQKLPSGLWRFTLSRALAPTALYVGKPWLLWENHFNSWALDVDGCKGCLLNSLNIEAAGGGGFSFWQNVGSVNLYLCTIGVPSKSGRLLAAGGGCMAFHNRGTVVFDHCNFSGIDDDGINIGTNFVHILAQVNAHTVRVEGGNVLFQTGDTAAIWNWAAGNERLEARIADAHANADGSWLLSFTQALPKLQTGTPKPNASRDAQEHDGIDRIVDFQDAGHLYVHDSQFSVMRARCILVKAPQSLIENSHFTNTHMPAILAGPEFYWGEGPAVHNLVIRGNMFTNIDTSSIRVGVFDSNTSEDNKNIIIQGNTFTGYGANPLPAKTYTQGNVIDVTNTRGVTIKGNKVGKPAPTAPAGVPRLIVKTSRQVVISHNVGLR